MHPAHSPLSQTARKVALHQVGIQPMRSELLLAPRTGEESPFVMDELGADLENSRYLGFKEHHIVELIA